MALVLGEELFPRKCVGVKPSLSKIGLGNHTYRYGPCYDEMRLFEAFLTVSLSSEEACDRQQGLDSKTILLHGLTFES